MSSDLATPESLAELIERRMERSMLEIEQLKSEIVSLRARVDRLETLPAQTRVPPARRGPEPAPAEPRAAPKIIRRSPMADAETGDPRDLEPDVFVAVASPRVAPRPEPAPATELDPAWTARLLARYAEATLDLGGAGERLIDGYHPVAITLTDSQDGYAIGGDPREAMLWAIHAGGTAYALLPGHKAINNWSTSFAANRTTTAAQYFGHAFDLAPGSPRLTVSAPAVATRPDARPRRTLACKGRLTGFRP